MTIHTERGKELPKVKIVRFGATHNRKPVGLIGSIVEVDEDRAQALKSFGYAVDAAEDATPGDAAEVTDTEIAEAEAVAEAAGPEPDEVTREAPAEAEQTPVEVPAEEPTAKEIREWAKANGVEVASHGAIPEEVREKYDAAHAE